MTITWETWATLDALIPMPISRTRDRIVSWLHQCWQQGLITRDEYDALCAADALDRQHAYEDRWGTA